MKTKNTQRLKVIKLSWKWTKKVFVIILGSILFLNYQGIAQTSPWSTVTSSEERIGGRTLSYNDGKVIGDFNGDGAEELLLVERYKFHPASLFKFVNNQWSMIYSNNGNGWINGWFINSDDKYTAGDIDNDGKDELICINPNGWAMVLDYENNSFTHQWNNGGNGYLGYWPISSATKIYSGDFDGNATDKEIFTVDDLGGSSAAAMIQNYQQGGYWSTIYNNNGNGWIGSWKINEGDRYIIGDLDGNGKMNDVLTVSPTVWSFVLSFNSSNTFTLNWHNSGSRTIGGWGKMSTDDIIIAGNIDGDVQDELLFIQTGKSAALSISQTLNTGIPNSLVANWSNNGNGQIGEWPLNYDTLVDYHFIRPIANQPKKLLALRYTPDRYTELLEVSGTQNMRVENTEIQESTDNSQTDLKLCNIYPNPSLDGFFRVEVPTKNDGLYRIVLSDLMGQEVYSQNLDQNEVEIKMPENSKGTFIVNIYKNDVLFKVSKVVVH